MSTVILGALASILGLPGLILADGAIDIVMYYFGLGLFGFALLYVFWLIKKHFDRSMMTSVRNPVDPRQWQ